MAQLMISVSGCMTYVMGLILLSEWVSLQKVSKSIVAIRITLL